jgi:hypothetical protein
MTAFAHEEGEGVAIGNYIFEFQSSEEEIFIGDVVKFTVHIKDIQGNDVSGLNVKYDIVREVITAEEAESAHYSIDHVFDTLGEYDIIVGFVEAGTGQEIITSFTVDVQGKEASFDAPWLAALILGLVLIWVFYGKKLMDAKGKEKSRSIKGRIKGQVKKGKKPSVITPIALTVIYLIIIFLGFSVYAFYASPAVEGCEIKVGDKVTMHCHPFLYIDICGDTKGFAWEHGSLDAWHTHKDSHKLHIHPPRAVTQQEKIQIMNLQTVARDMSFVFAEESIQDPESGTIYTEGNMCNDGKDNKIIVTINGEEKSYQDAINYLIQDGDRIRIKYE